MEKEEIIRRVRDAVAQVPHVRIAYVYGSLLTRSDFRDIDIALLVDPAAGRDAPAIAAEAGDRIEQAIGFAHECDIHLLNGQPAWFLYEVISTGTAAFVRDEEDRVDFETGVLVEYQDLRYLYDLFDREYLAQDGVSGSLR